MVNANSRTALAAASVDSTADDLWIEDDDVAATKKISPAALVSGALKDTALIAILDVGGFAISNVGTVDGVTVSAHAARHERAGADEIDGDHLDVDFTPSNYTPATTPAEAAHVDDLAAHLQGIDTAIGAAGGAHAADHIQGGSDEVDGDHLDIDFTPSVYTPSTSPAEASDVNHLTAHLAGVDDFLLRTPTTQTVGTTYTISDAAVTGGAHDTTHILSHSSPSTITVTMGTAVAGTWAFIIQSGGDYPLTFVGDTGITVDASPAGFDPDTNEVGAGVAAFWASSTYVFLYGNLVATP